MSFSVVNRDHKVSRKWWHVIEERKDILRPLLYTETGLGIDLRP